MPNIYDNYFDIHGWSYEPPVNKEDNPYPYTVSNGSIRPSIIPVDNQKSTDFIKSMVETYLNEYCYGITLDEVLELIRKHQPERLL